MRKRPPQPECFKDGKDSYVEAFERLRRNEPRRHTSIVAIIRLDCESELLGLPNDEQARRCGYGRYRAYDWISDGDSGLPSIDNSGSVIFLKDDVGRLQTLILLKDAVIPENVLNPDEELAAINIAVLLHEVGHVDDAEKGINIKRGGRIAVKESEVYAHHYACNRMMKEHLLYPLARYLEGIVGFNATDRPPAACDAAVEFMRSAEYGRYRECASRHRGRYSPITRATESRIRRRQDLKTRIFSREPPGSASGP